MTEIPFWAGEAALAIVWIAARAMVWKKQNTIEWKREAALLLMAVNLAVLLRLTFFPWATVNGRVQPLYFDPGAVLPFRVNLVPFVHLLRFGTKRDLILNLAGNVAMFIPGGIILPVLWKKLRSFPKTVAAGAFISLCIELLQLPFFGRATDVDDLILNTLGCAAGYGIYSLFRGTHT